MSEDGIRITFVRHGQTEANLTRRWQGQGDSPLSALGVQQARLLGERLKLRSYSHVVCSDLSRAIDTTRATGLSFSIDPALREFDVGAWEGLTAEEVEARYPDDLERLRQGEDVALGGGESFATFSARIDGALAALRARLSPADHALVVCHGGVIGTVLSGALGLRKARSFSTARAANTSITELSYTRDGVQLHVFNDTLHLLPLGAWPSHGELKGNVALLCEVPAQHAFGELAARYEHEALRPPGEDLALHLYELCRRHPEQRVGLAAAAGQIHAWAEATWFCSRADPRASTFGETAATGRLAEPLAGSVSHAGWQGERLLLLDYGIRG